MRGWALALVASTGLSCGRGCGAQEAARPRTLVLGTTQEPATLDPAFVLRSSERALSALVYRGLVERGDDGRVRPDLAAELPEIETSSAGARVRWTLRPGLQWARGRPVGTEDVVLGHRVATHPELEARGAIASEATIHPLDALRFEVRWPRAVHLASAPGVHPVLPAYAYPALEAAGPASRGLGWSAEAANGPFRLEEHRPGQWASFVPNPVWVGPRPGLDRVVYRFFPSEDAFDLELASGGLDGLGPASGASASHLLRLAKTLPDHTLVRTPSGMLLQLLVQLSHPLLGQRGVRQRLSAAVDRETMAQRVYDGLARPAYGIYGQIHPAHSSRAASEEQGTELPKGTRLTLAIASGSEASERAAVHLRDAFSAVGVELSIDAKPLRVLLDALESGHAAPLTLFALRTRPDWSGDTLLASDGRMAWTGYRNPELDAHFWAAEHTLDEAVWISELRAAEALVMRDLPIIPLLFRDELTLVPRDLKGWKPTGTSSPVTWNAEAWRRSPTGAQSPR